jgi:hypothetical protein
MLFFNNKYSNKNLENPIDPIEAIYRKGSDQTYKIQQYSAKALSASSKILDHSNFYTRIYNPISMLINIKVPEPKCLVSQNLIQL